MRLKYHVDFAEAALARRRQSGSNLSRMMAVVINHADPGRLAAQLEAPVYAAKVFQRPANVIGPDIETDSDRNRRRRIQHIVHAGHMQAEFAQVAFAVSHAKMTGGHVAFGAIRTRTCPA